jgi:hypothetical protein
MSKLEFSSLIECFVWISETKRVFCHGFSPFDATFKGKQRDNVNKARTHFQLLL